MIQKTPKSIDDILIDQIQYGDYSVERAIIIASGLKTEEKIEEFRTKIDELQERFYSYCDERSIPLFWESEEENRPDQVQVAIALHDFLDRGQNDRKNSNFSLQNTIISQLSYDSQDATRDSVALISLFSILGIRSGLDLSLLLNPGHADNPDFDIKSKFSEFEREQFSFLISFSYNTSGKHKLDDYDYKGAINDFDRALIINPNNINPYINRSKAKFLDGDTQGALIDLSIANYLIQDYSPAHFLLGIIKLSQNDTIGAMKAFHRAGDLQKKCGDTPAALISFNKSLEILPNAYAYTQRGEIKWSLDDLEGAIKDFNLALEINSKYEPAIINKIVLRKQMEDLSVRSANYVDIKNYFEAIKP